MSTLLFYIIQHLLFTMDAFKVLMVLCVASYCECRDIPNVGIFGGENITIEQAPFMAQVRYKGEVVCGGSIIHKRYVLTTVECLDKEAKISDIDVLIGTELENKADKGKLYGVKAIYDNPQFSAETKEFDASLIQLSELIQFSKKVMSVSLANEQTPELPIGSELNVAGWGMIKRSNKSILNSEQLTRVALKTISQEDCQRAYDEAGASIKVTTNMICATGEGKGACYGDGGGPLTAVQNGRTLQYGLVFFSHRDCGNKPTVFTKTSVIRNWISDVIHSQ